MPTEKVFTARFPKKLHGKLRMDSAKNNTPMNTILNKALEEYYGESKLLKLEKKLDEILVRLEAHD